MGVCGGIFGSRDAGEAGGGGGRRGAFAAGLCDAVAGEGADGCLGYWRREAA